jgi:peptidyl-prolyl cis-trans isomerase A (cyclophilin A)
MKFLVLAVVIASQPLKANMLSDSVRCMIRTDLGEITIVLYPDRAPITVNNFLAYVDQKLYNGSSFFRVCTPENEAERTIKIQVIQGGDVPEEKCAPPIIIERTRDTGILHKNGVVSMARDTPDSATSSFFICIGDQPELDFGGKRNPDGQGFAAFGKVTSGMEIALDIQKQKNKDQYLLDPVKIIEIKRIE